MKGFLSSSGYTLKMDCGLQRDLLVLSFVLVATVLASQREDVSYQDALSSAVHLYNLERGLAFAFRLLEAKTQLEWDSQKQAPQNLEFTVKETICPGSEQANPEECAFKEDGVVKECSGTFVRQQAVSTIQVTCEAAAEKKSQRKRVRRIAVMDIIRKLRNRFNRGRPGDKSLTVHRGAPNRRADWLNAPPRRRGGAEVFSG